MILAGLTAGAVAAIVAALVSLPLHSPVDSVFNSFTVTVAALLVGLIAGVLWMRLPGKVGWYAACLGGLFIVALVIAFIGSMQLDRMDSFMMPLAAIVIVITALLTPLLASYFSRPNLGWKSWAPAAVSVVAALVVGFGLITQGDAETRDLALPPAPAATPLPLAASGATAIPADQTTATPEQTTAPVAQATSATPAPGGQTTVTPEQTTAPMTTDTPVPADPATAIPEQTTAPAGESFIIGEGSKIVFTVEEELGRSPIRFDAQISGTGLTGVANLDGSPSVVTLDLHSLSSDQPYRDRYIQSRMFPNTPEAVVTVDRLPDLPQSFFDGEETTGELDGSLQIGDTVTPLVFGINARRDGDVINVLGTTTFTWEQLGLEKPTARPVVYLADEVRVKVLLVARAAP